MSQKAILIIISCLLALAIADEHGTKRRRQEKTTQMPCGKNEQFARSGIDCLTCENYQNTNCTVVNEEKCYCLEGYVRDYEYNCINKTECATACRPNEHYSNKAPCEYMCGGGDHIPERCNCSLASGCVCNKGYVRCDLTHSCIPEGDCYPKCNENEVPSRAWCQPYCENNQVVHRPCPLLIILGCNTRCVCRQGYIRDGKTGKCIPIEECTGKTSTDAVLTSPLA